MPDPGEPHRPERDHFASDDDYRIALAEYIRMTYPPDQVEMLLSTRRGLLDIEEYLETHSER